MFDGIRRIWKGIRQMFGYTTLKSIAGKEVAISDAMINAINDWKHMIDGSAAWTTDYIRSLRIEDGICREFADVVLTEMETNIDNKRLDKVYQKTVAKLNENLQGGLGLGSFAIKPLGADSAEFVAADKIIPISFDDDGMLSDVGFLTVKQVGTGSYYTRFERHYFINGNLTIENKCYHSQSKENIGSPCDLSAVDEWAGISPGPVTYPGMKQMDFGYYRNPLENRIDGSKCGVSVFESARERIKAADVQGARLDWEYDSGERAVHVDARALNYINQGMAKLNKRLYRGLNIDDGKDKELLKEYSPEMRDESFRRGLEDRKREIEFIVGLAYGDLSNVQEVEKTATEIKVSKSRKYNRVTAIQENLRICLEGFAAGLAFYNGLYRSGYGFNCKFNDSILTDEETERKQDREDVAMGAMQMYEYRMKWYNEDEATARAAVGTPAEVIE